MTWTLFRKWLEAQADGNLANTPVDFDSDTLKVALVTDNYAPEFDSDDFWADAQPHEVGPAGNYTAGGEPLINRTVTLAGGTVTFDNTADLTWLQSGSGFADARFAVLYKEGASAATSPLIACADFGGDKGNLAGDLTLQFDGIITWS